MSNFTGCLAFSLRAEGGLIDDPLDPGGITNWGVTREGLEDYRECPCTADDIRTLQRAEATAVYHKCYWTPMRCDDLPAGLDLIVFDFGINAGAHRSIVLLQHALGVADDGKIGPHTIEAAQGKGAVLRARIGALSHAHEAFYHALPGYAHDGKGWTARVLACQATAMKMACGLAYPPVTPALPKPQRMTVTA